VDNLFTLLIIVIFVAPLIERIFKGARGQQQQQQGRPPQRPLPRSAQQRLPDGTTDASTESAEPASTRDASDIIPGELWEILTGQKRPQPQPEERPPPPPPAPPARKPLPAARRHTPAPRRPLPAPLEDDEAGPWPPRRRTVEAQSREDAAAADLMRKRERALEKARRFEPSPPVIVSLETEPLPEPHRHTAFHDKLDRLSAAPRGRPRPIAMLEFDPSDRAALQRAIILHEVLGKPKGLE